MMPVVKIGIFSFIVISVKVMFSLFFQCEDVKLYRMKEISEFIDYLRIYSCSMKMSVSEIIERYSFKYNEVSKVFGKLVCDDSYDTYSDEYGYKNYIKECIQSPEEFNAKLACIIDFYGISFSDVLNDKLILLKNDLDKFINSYEGEYRERKKLLNKLSLMIGCLIAIILI